MKNTAYILLFVLSFVNGFSQMDDSMTSTTGKDSLQVFSVVEEMPEFPGGEKEMYLFIMNNLNYPMEAKENGIEGKVFVKFTVSSTGKIINPAILKSSGSKLLDNEAIRLINSMPIWKPGKQSGVPVATYYNLPLNFKLGKGYKTEK